MRHRVQAVKDARDIFWKHLRKIQFNVAVPKGSDFVHVGTTVRAAGGGEA